MGEGDAEPVHALRAIGRKIWIVVLNAACIAQHLREVEATSCHILLIPAQGLSFALAGGICPEGIGRDNGIGRLLMDGEAKWEDNAAFGSRKIIGA